MIGREARADLQVGDDARAERLGERDARIPAPRLRDDAADQDHGALRRLQQRRGLAQPLCGAGALATGGMKRAASSGGSGSASFASCISASRLT